MEFAHYKLFTGVPTKGEFTIEPWYPNKKTAPNNYESVQVY